MATRFYLPNTGAAAAAVSPAFGSAWGVTANVNRFLTSTTKQNTTLVSETSANYAETSATAINVLHKQYVSDVLPAQTISGSFTAVVRGGEDTAATDASLQIVIRVVSNDGATERGVLYAGHTATLNSTAGAIGQEFATSSQSRIFPSTALSSLAVSANDRLVIEVGQRFHNTSATSVGGYLTLGDATATADFTLTAGTTTSLCPWVELTGDVFTTAATSDPPPAAPATRYRHLLVR